MADSLSADLKAWEEKSTKRKQDQVELTITANSLREKGNEHFRAGDFENANRLYTESLAQNETVEALANRALARLKLSRPNEAIEDCSRVLVLDPKNVKGWARRGTAKSSLGDHEGALRDFQEAERLDPSNKVLRREREREEAFLQAIAATSGTNAGQEDDNDSDQHGEPEPKAAVAESKTKSAALKQAPGLNDEVVKQAISSVEATIDLPEAAPRTAYSFKQVWRDLHGRADLRRRLVCERMTEQDLERCFGSNLELDVLMDILQVVEGDELLGVLSSLARLKSFALIKLMLDPRRKELILGRCGSSETARKVSDLLQ